MTTTEQSRTVPLMPALRGLDAHLETLSGAQRLGSGQLTDLWTRLSGLLHLAAGRLDEARAQVESATAPPFEFLGSAGDVIRMITYAELARHTGEDRLGVEAARFARRMRQSEDPTARLWATRVLATAADPDQAARLLENDPIVSMAGPFPADHDFIVFATGLAITTAHPGLASRVRVAATALVEAGGEVPLLRGLAAYVHGALDRETERLELAVELLKPVSRPLLYAAALEQTGAVLAARGKLRAALTRRRTALDTFTGCRATADVERLTRLLREGGQRQQQRDRRPTFGWASLTETERRVVREVAGGATNREAARSLLLSPHTVNTHVRHAYAKLDINSRVQLANLVHRIAE